MDYRRLKPYHGLLLFAVVIAALVFIATPLQYNFGIIGVALTELMLLALTAAAFFITRPHFGQTFPLRLPPVREFFGGAFIYAGTYLLMIPPLLLTQYFFPQINDTADSLAKLGTSVPPALTILIIAVMPAICEETLHRGYILSSLKPIKNTALIVLINGLIFGIFHLDPFRFLPTMMLGCAFAYIALKTESMVLTMLFHFINNLLSVISMFTMRSSDVPKTLPAMQLASVIGVGLIYAAIGAVLLFVGVCMLRRIAPKATVIAAVVIGAIVISVTGVIITGYSSITTVCNLSGTFNTSESNGETSIPLELDRDGIYSFSVSALSKNNSLTFTLEKDSKVILTQGADKTLLLSQTLELDAGSYVMRITLDPEREGVYGDVTVQIIVLRFMG